MYIPPLPLARMAARAHVAPALYNDAAMALAFMRFLLVMQAMVPQCMVPLLFVG